jgi:hypothetical protein
MYRAWAKEQGLETASANPSARREVATSGATPRTNATQEAPIVPKTPPSTTAPSTAQQLVSETPRTELPPVSTEIPLPTAASRTEPPPELLLPNVPRGLPTVGPQAAPRTSDQPSRWECPTAHKMNEAQVRGDDMTQFVPPTLLEESRRIRLEEEAEREKYPHGKPPSGPPNYPPIKYSPSNVSETRVWDDGEWIHQYMPRPATDATIASSHES